MITLSRRSVELTEVHDQGRDYPAFGSNTTTTYRLPTVRTIFDNLLRHLAIAPLNPTRPFHSPTTGSPAQMTASLSTRQGSSSLPRGI